MEKRVVATLLTLMDGASDKRIPAKSGTNNPNEDDTNNTSAEETTKKPPRIVVMGATNRPNALDEALRRPGRFDREVEIGIPDAKARAEILVALLKRIPNRLTTAEVEHLASVSHGYVGADLAAVCREAGLKTIHRVMSKDVKSVEEVTLDLQAQFRAMSVSDSTTAAATGKVASVEEKEEELMVSAEDMRLAMTEVKPSAMREIMIEVPKVLWSDIGGQEEIKQKLKESVEWPLQVLFALFFLWFLKLSRTANYFVEIGRASCRERVL